MSGFSASYLPSGRLRRAPAPDVLPESARRHDRGRGTARADPARRPSRRRRQAPARAAARGEGARRGAGRVPRDRKSTRLNSSHPSISYAVFCLKKKNKHYQLFFFTKKKKKNKK